MSTNPPAVDLSANEQTVLLRIPCAPGAKGPGHPAWSDEVAKAVATLDRAGLVEWGVPGSPNEFWVVRLADIHAPGALMGYARMADSNDPELASEVRAKLARAGTNSAFCSAACHGEYHLDYAPHD